MQGLSADKKPSPPEARADDGEVREVRDLLGSLLIALRNHALYPEEHAICRNAVASLQGRLAAFLEERGSLRLGVERDRFLLDGGVVHQGPPQDDYLPFQLFRDGIQWIEFRQGIDAEELGSLFRMLIRYRTPKEEADGDLVTALWEAGLPHLHYGKEEVLWRAEPLIDFSLFQAGPGESRDAGGEEEAPAPASPKIRMPAADPAFWRLTPDEERSIREMVLDEETRDGTEDVLDVLTIILREQRDPDNFSVILDFLAEEFGYALAQGEFAFVRKLQESLDALGESMGPEEPWTLQLLDGFRRRIAGPEVLVAIEQSWPPAGGAEGDRIEILRRVLLWFPPEVVETLGPMLLRTDRPEVERLLGQAISEEAARDAAPLARLLEGAEERLVLKLIPLLREMEGRAAADLLFGLTSRPEDPVRRDSLQALLAGDCPDLRPLFPLIEDPHPAVRGLILGHLGKRRNTVFEELLLNYLEKGRFRIRESPHILACYRALGRCGSSRSLPFLKGALLKRDWKALLGIGVSLQRQGAALALMEMPDGEGAREALAEASRSLFTGIRSAVRRAEEERMRRKERGR